MRSTPCRRAPKRSAAKRTRPARRLLPRSPLPPRQSARLPQPRWRRAISNLLKKRADAELAYADNVLATAKSDRAKAMAEDFKQKNAAKIETLPAQLDAAKADAKAKQDAAAAAAATAKTAEATRSAAAQAATDAKLAGAPVSIFISRATQKLYVRRDTHKRLAGRRRAVRFQPGIPGHDQGSRQADRHAHLHRCRTRRWGQRWRLALDRSQHRQRRQR